jgi:hypothetical protein
LFPIHAAAGALHRSVTGLFAKSCASDYDVMGGYLGNHKAGGVIPGLTLIADTDADTDPKSSKKKKKYKKIETSSSKR